MESEYEYKTFWYRKDLMEGPQEDALTFEDGWELADWQPLIDREAQSSFAARFDVFLLRRVKE